MIPAINDTPLQDSQLAGLEAPEFKKLMRAIASSVAVITTCHDGHPHGMTATAFSSVSADPPTALIVLNKGTRTHPLISASRRFVVNVLQKEQVKLGERFAGKLDDQFQGLDYRIGQTGVPILNDVVSYFECETISEVDVGTHTIFVGRVVAGEAMGLAPLLYHGGQYKTLVEQQPT